MEYVYLLQEREFVKSNEQVYKIGRTKQLNFARFRQYPKNSISFFQSYCDDCVVCENKIIKVFSKKYKKRIDIGQEYFEGNVYDMIVQISIIVQKNIQDKIDNMYHENNSIKLRNEINAEFFINKKLEKKTNTCQETRQETTEQEQEETTEQEQEETSQVTTEQETTEQEDSIPIPIPTPTPKSTPKSTSKSTYENIVLFIISFFWRHAKK
jgi:hypothetical protein